MTYLNSWPVHHKHILKINKFRSNEDEIVMTCEVCLRSTMGIDRILYKYVVGPYDPNWNLTKALPSAMEIIGDSVNWSCAMKRQTEDIFKNTKLVK